MDTVLGKKDEGNRSFKKNKFGTTKETQRKVKSTFSLDSPVQSLPLPVYKLWKSLENS